jgi:U4/U6 small nuclear ribonucleoprotein PRP3
MALENGVVADGKEERQERRKRKRWGERPPAVGENAALVGNSAHAGLSVTAAAAPSQHLSPSQSPPQAVANDPKARLLAAQESIRARLAAAKANLYSAPPPTSDSLVPSETTTRPTKRAKVYELDLTVTAPTFQDVRAVVPSAPPPAAVSATKSKTPEPASVPTKISNPYLAHQYSAIQTGDNEDGGGGDAVDEFIDDRLQRASKPRNRHKELTFVEPGKWQEIADTKRAKEFKAVASGYTSGRKTGHTIQAPTLAAYTGSLSAVDEDTVPPRADAHPDTKMPLALEWWDMELLPTKLKKIVAALESKGLVPAESTNTKSVTSHTDAGAADQEMAYGDTPDMSDESDLQSLRTRCFEQASLSYSKTAALVQHIVPIKPPNVDAAAPPKEAVLRLTKKEMKRQRKLRRQEKQRELQDLQAAGLVAAPEPRLTLRNFIQVLGDQAFLDPSKIEQKVQEQMQARQQAHLERNAAAKLTKEQRAAKRARKLAEDTTHAVATALFYVKDMSHPYHRTKVDLNAQQLSLSGCVLECAQDPSLACIIVEGGPKAIKRYSRLLLVRMKWTGLDGAAIDDDEDDDDMEEPEMDGLVTHKFNPHNKCEFVWQGMVVKRLFHGFLFQACETHDQARKILKAKGALHYWDQVLQHASGQSGKFQFKMAPDDQDENPFQQFSGSDEEMEGA